MAKVFNATHSSIISPSASHSNHHLLRTHADHHHQTYWYIPPPHYCSLVTMTAAHSSSLLRKREGRDYYIGTFTIYTTTFLLPYYILILYLPAIYRSQYSASLPLLCWWEIEIQNEKWEILTYVKSQKWNKIIVENRKIARAGGKHALQCTTIPLILSTLLQPESTIGCSATWTIVPLSNRFHRSLRAWERI